MIRITCRLCRLHHHHIHHSTSTLNGFPTSYRLHSPVRQSLSGKGEGAQTDGHGYGYGYGDGRHSEYVVYCIFRIVYVEGVGIMESGIGGLGVGTCEMTRETEH